MTCPIEIRPIHRGTAGRPGVYQPRRRGGQGTHEQTIVMAVDAGANNVVAGSFVILIGTGSEVALCVAAYEALIKEGIAARVVSMPCWELFERQDQAYRDGVLPPRVRARVAVEEGADFGWCRYAGIDGAIIGMETFGASAPIQKVQEMFGFEPAHVIQAARDQLARQA